MVFKNNGEGNFQTFRASSWGLLWLLMMWVTEIKSIFGFQSSFLNLFPIDPSKHALLAYMQMTKNRLTISFGSNNFALHSNCRPFSAWIIQQAPMIHYFYCVALISSIRILACFALFAVLICLSDNGFLVKYLSILRLPHFIAGHFQLTNCLITSTFYCHGKIKHSNYL